MIAPPKIHLFMAFFYLIPYDKECKVVENIVVSHLLLASLKIK
jgi:hypothetical protein